MTVADRPARANAGSGSERTGNAGSVVDDIAARRREDIDRELGSADADDALQEALAAAPAPRSFVAPFLRSGTHVIAEVKRSSPSAGRIATADQDLVAQARAYVAGGAAAISVLCEPHWFGGSVDDLRRVRAAVGVPVLAKEFIVDPRQLAQVRAAGADAVLLLVVLHRTRRRLAGLVRQASELGLEPLVEAHDRRELELAIESGARVIGINNRDLRTLTVDLGRAEQLRDLVPDDRIVIAESGVREPATVARWRARGFDGALIGEALMRSADPAAAVRAFAAAGAAPADPANVARRPLVKICGITDEVGMAAAVTAGADAVGINVVAGTPRALEIAEAASLAALARGLRAGATRPSVVLITADAGADLLADATAAVDPDAIQFNGQESSATVAGSPRPAWKVVHVLPSDDGRSDHVAAARRWLEAGVDRLLVDTAGGPHQGGTGMRADRDTAAAIARRGAGHPGRRPDRGQRRSGPPRDPGRRRGRRVRRRGAAGPRRAADQGPVPRRVVREARQGRTRRPPERAVRADPGPRGPARC